MRFNPGLRCLFVSASTRKKYEITGITYRDGERREVEAVSCDSHRDVIVCPIGKLVEWMDEGKIVYAGINL